jgi:hypothetical protein
MSWLDYNSSAFQQPSDSEKIERRVSVRDGIRMDKPRWAKIPTIIGGSLKAPAIPKTPSQ